MMSGKGSFIVGLCISVAFSVFNMGSAHADSDEKYKIHFRELWKCADTLGLIESGQITLQKSRKKYTYEFSGDSGYGVSGKICEPGKSSSGKNWQTDGYDQGLEECSLNMTESQLNPLREELNRTLKKVAHQKPEEIRKKILGCGDIEAVKSGYGEALAAVEALTTPNKGPAEPASARPK